MTTPDQPDYTDPELRDVDLIVRILAGHDELVRGRILHYLTDRFEAGDLP